MRQGTPAVFIAGSPGLDFLNSVATPADRPVDWLESGEGFVGWLAEAGLVPADALREVASRAKPGELDRAAAQARALREWFRAFLGKHGGRPLTARALRELGPLNELLARDETFIQLSRRDDAEGLELHRQRRWRSPDSLLFPVAGALAELLASGDLAHVKACEGERCTLLFADRTRGQARRWCSMAICGNRAKQAAYRERLKRKS